MTAPVLDMNNVPIWVNILIYMAMYQWYLLAAILPTVYILIVKLFGFPLLQRWSNEVVIMLYPNKVKFSKITSQFEPYFQTKKGVYWTDKALQPIELKKKFIIKKKGKVDEMERTVIIPPNTIHIFTHAINQEVYSMERRDAKVSEIVNGEHLIKRIPSHGIWIMNYFPYHFHRHWLLTIDTTGTYYLLEPVKQKQQFAVNFFHTLGVVYQQAVEKPTNEIQLLEEGEGGKVLQIAVTNQYIVSKLKFVQEYPNFSAARFYKIAKRLHRLEKEFYYWVSGSFNPVLLVVLIGAVGAIGLVIYMMHGSGPPTGLGPMPGGH